MYNDDLIGKKTDNLLLFKKNFISTNFSETKTKGSFQ